MGKSEQSSEASSRAVAEKTAREEAAIVLYTKMDQDQAKAAAKKAAMQKLVHVRLAEHHLMQDFKGRVEPDVLLALASKEDQNREAAQDAHEDEISEDAGHVGDATDD